MTGWAVGKGRSGWTLAPRARRRRFRMRQITRLYLSSLRRKTPDGGFPLSHPLHSLRRLANMRLSSTKTECCAMLVINKGPNKGWLFDPNKGSNLGHPVGFFCCRKFSPPQFFGYCPRRKSSHLMASSHSGLFLFYHYNLPGSCLRTVIQPLTETAGLLISWVFSFLPRTIPASTDQ